VYSSSSFFHRHDEETLELPFFLTGSSTFFLVPKRLLFGPHIEQAHEPVAEDRVGALKSNLSLLSAGDNSVPNFVERFQYLFSSTHTTGC
jgi:hypothetical protein